MIITNNKKAASENGENLPSPSNFNIFIILTILLHFAVPIKTIVFAPVSYFGIIVLLIGLLLNVWSIRILRSYGTGINFHDKPVKLVLEGPFGISRNPIYLSGVIVLLGAAIFLGSLITFIFPIILFIIINSMYIPIEEKRLEKIFGNEYRNYKRRVRKWI